ncbi:MAG: glycerol-3-phosphate dehydrogenase/oxidase [Candidatus Poribacteria bacterium]|nr:glycerol-3-phosphate dehydrogenase/oxidase [Candidatus Poribacteria bacterium]
MPTEFSARTRSENIKILKSQLLDVLVIGGGIVGAGVIRDLALNGGIKAGLIEQSDFASGTSSTTSQLIHGGFRYLLKRDIDLVKKSRQERETLRRIAPNLVKPIPLALLCYKGDPYPLTGMQLFAHYYNRLSKVDKAEKSIAIRDSQKIQHLLGSIDTSTLKGCVVLWDSTVDDARLTLATLKDAHRHGAIISNYVRFLDFVNPPDTGNSGNRTYKIAAEDVTSGQRFEISARKIVSATGPWSDHVWRKDPSYDGVPRLATKNAKGIHIILPRCGKEDDSGMYGLITFTRSERQHGGKSRVIFILPGAYNTSIVGTTETTPEEELSSVRPSADEVAYLLSETQRIFPEKTLNNNIIIGGYAGTRPLIAANRHRRGFAKTDFVSREHLITESPSGVMYLYGGKLTTHRQMAEETVNLLAQSVNVRRHCKTDIQPLPNAVGEVASTDQNHDLQSNTNKERLIKRYGEGHRAIRDFISEDPTLAEPITPSLPFIKAELLYACWGEMAMTLDDLLWRRTRIGWTPGQGLDLAPQIAQFLGEKNNWDQARITAEVETYRERIRWLNSNL